MATRQTLMLPPRSLTKYRYLPSGAHTGFQSTAASFVTDRGSPPSAGIVQMSRCPPGRSGARLVQYAIRYWCGDHWGCPPVAPLMRRVRPVVTLTVHSSLLPTPAGSVTTFCVAKITSAPSGDHSGLYPVLESRLTDSPVRPITKRPPFARSDRNAISSPSGEKAGSVSVSTQSFVRLIGSCPPTA